MVDRNKNIFVVEDEITVSSIITEQLISSGYKIWGTATSGEDALAILLGATEKPDAVLMDIVLAGNIDGVETAKQIIANFNLPVVFLTAYSDDQTFARVQGIKPYGYLVKPISHVELIFALGLAIEQHRLKPHSAAVEEGILAPVDSKQTDTSKDEVVESITKISMFKLLPPEVINTLKQRATRKYYEAGENILLEGSEQKFGFVVIRGCVSVIKSSNAHARELIVDTIVPGDSSGMLAVIESVPMWYTARAQLDSDILLISTQLLINIFDKYPECYREILKETSNKLKSSYVLSKGLAYNSVEQRIVDALSFLVEKAGVVDPETGLPTLHLTRRELADYTGTTVETAYRVTKRMEREGALKLPSPGYMTSIDLAKLRINRDWQ